MLFEIFEQLHRWMKEENGRRHADGGLPLPQALIKVLEQAALIEANVDLHLLATTDFV